MGMTSWLGVQLGRFEVRCAARTETPCGFSNSRNLALWGKTELGMTHSRPEYHEDNLVKMYSWPG